ncbi:slyX protein [Gemmobacter lanyuensis]|uniref:SlyX protein n=1 Tax=Gemmobacter lanyuensis TaxID=1054497 RepID=A0A918IRI2_9RHOB|nr:SlyX family protein [Gemmobacter lanyuensis]GGW24772.1 slyX protein [Gemmobacter lanyuensis]
MERITAMEELLAHLTRTVEDLSDVMASQALEIDQLKRRVLLLLEREAEREAMERDGAGAIPLADQKPPHW